DLVGPDALRCRVAIVWSCSVIPAAGALVQPRWSLLARWLASPSIGALLAPWGVSFVTFAGLVTIAEDVLESPSVGEAISRFYLTDDSSSGRVRLCLFGDPRMQPMPADGCWPAPRTSTAPTVGPLWEPSASLRRGPQGQRDTSPRESTITRARLEVVRRVVDGAASRVEPGSAVEPLAREAVALVRDVVEWPCGSVARSQSVHARRVVLRFLAHCEPVWNYLLP